MGKPHIIEIQNGVPPFSERLFHHNGETLRQGLKPDHQRSSWATWKLARCTLTNLCTPEPLVKVVYDVDRTLKMSINWGAELRGST